MLLPASTISGLGLAVGVIHLLLEGRARNRAIGVFPVAVAAVFALAATAFDPLRRPEAGLPPASAAIHASAAVLGYAGLLLAALFGALYLVQRGALKRHRFGLFWERLPSLELLDEFAFRSLVAGVACFTVTIAVGHIVRRATGHTGSYWDPKIVATNLIWLIGLVVVLGRLFRRVRPATSAAASIALFALALANLLVVDIFSEVHRGI